MKRLLLQPALLVLRQAVVELADGDAQLGCGFAAVAAVAGERGEDVFALDVFHRLGR